MPAINLTIDKNMFAPKFISLLTDYSHRWEVYKGSAGSGKSYFITQKIIYRCLTQEGIRVLVCRKYGTTLRNTCFSLFKEVLSSWKLTPYVKVRETDFNIKFPNGSEVIFTGLDEETKLLSLNNISVIFIEEAYEVERSIVEQLNLRLRGKAENQQIIMAFNPINKNSWLYEFVMNPPESFYYSHSTYKDNPFLSKEYVASLEELYTRSPAKARIFCDGEWGVNPEGLVLTNWTSIDFDAMSLAKTLEHRAGCDLGWIDKTAIVDTLYDKENKTIYVFNEFYKSGQQLSDIANAIKDMGLSKVKLYVDCAEPRSIDYFRTQNINATPSLKGKDSIKAGMMFLQDNKLVVHPSCKNFINELENFSYIQSKKTGEWTEETTHEFSHAIDACRYAYSDIYTQNKIKTFDKSLLGL